MKHELRIMVFILLPMILASLFMIHPVYAQTPSASPSAVTLPTTTYNLPTTVSPTSPLYTDMLVHNMFHTFSCLAVGSSVIGQPCLTYQVTQDAQGAIQSMPVLSQVNLQGGTLGAVTGLIGALYQNPPVRTYDYLASVGQDLGIVKEANAQVVGSGAQVLSPILTLWQVSRNISYLIMIIIFIIIGLMVMFRNRINPQTVITAQAALPGLVIGLILITFSYFLAGLISDTAFIGTNLIGYYFQTAQGNPPQNLVDEIGKQNILSVLSPITKITTVGRIHGVLNSIWDSLATPTDNNLPWNFGPQQVLTSLATMIIAQFVLPFGGVFGGIGQLVGGGGAALITITSPIFAVGFAFAFVGMAILIYTMFRLLLRLINNYLSIIFLTITAPFQFLAAALPGRQGIATGWILNMLSNVLAFPAVIGVLYFVAYLLGPDISKQYCTDPCPFNISQLNQMENKTVVPTVHAADGATVVGNYAFPLLAGFDLDFVRMLLAFGALVALPAVPDIIKRAMGTVSQAGQLIGQEIGAGTGGGQRYAGQLQSGTQGFAGQVGRLTDQPGIQYISDPKMPEGYRKIPTVTPGQLKRFGGGLTDFQARARNIFRR